MVFSTIVYDKTSSAGFQIQFATFPAPSGRMIRHRITTTLTYGTTYYVKVRVWCSDTVNRASDWSTTVTIRIVSPNWPDATITAGTTLIRAVHFTTLRDAINNLRLYRGLSTYTFTDILTAGTTMIRATHLTELRTALNDAHRVAAVTNPTYTDGTITSGTTLIRKVHIDELRSFATRP